MDEKLIKDIVSTRNAIRKKYQAIKTNKIDSDIQLENTFKPITRPLEELIDQSKQTTKKKKEPKIKSEIEDDGEWKTPYKPKRLNVVASSTPNNETFVKEEFKTPVHSFRDSSEISKENETLQAYTNSPNRLFKILNIKDNEIDNMFGPHLDHERNVWKIGNAPFVVNDENIIIKNKEYTLSSGLSQLLFMKHPNEKLCNEEDYKNYKDILTITSAARRKYDENN